MSTVHKALLVALTVALMVGLAGSPASAQTKTRKDKIGDAPAAADIRSVKVQNNGDTFAYTVRLTRLVRGRSLVSVGVSGPADLEHPTRIDVVALTTLPQASGRYRTSVTHVSGDFQDGLAGLTIEEVACPGLRTRTEAGRRGFARIVLPQSCLGTVAGRVVAAVTAADLDGLDADLDDLEGLRDLGTLRSAALGARRGDGPADLPLDALDSPVTTRRG